MKHNDEEIFESVLQLTLIRTTSMILVTKTIM